MRKLHPLVASGGNCSSASRLGRLMFAGKPHTSVLLLNADIYLLFGHLFSTPANHAAVSTFLVWVLVFYQLGPFWLHT